VLSIGVRHPPRSKRSNGTLLLKHLVTHKLVHNIDVICAFLEQICTCIVVQNTLQTNEFRTIHDIMLPHAWLAAVWHKFTVPTERHDWEIVLSLLITVEIIFENLLAEKSPYMRVFGESLSDNFRSIYVQRICYALCILGHNCSSIPELQLGVHATVQSINETLKKSTPHTSAQTWQDLAKLVNEVPYSNISSVVHILDSRFEDVQLKPTGARVVRFHSPESLSVRLGVKGLLHVLTEEKESEVMPAVESSSALSVERGNTREGFSVEHEDERAS